MVGLGMQTYYSLRHLQSAGFFVRRSERVEIRVLRNPENAGLTQILQSYVAASLFASTAFLEALCSELIGDAATPSGGHLSTLGADVLHRVADIGKRKRGDRPPAGKNARPLVLARFDQILDACGKAPLADGAAVAAEVQLAVRFRNRLVHYKAEWMDVGTDEFVRSGNFMHSDFKEDMQERFPRLSTAGLLGADVLLRSDCAAWALRSAVAYADEIFRRLAIDPIYSHVRPDLDRSAEDARTIVVPDGFTAR